MASGTIVGTPWQDTGYTYLAVGVDEPEGRVEYIGKVLTADLADLTGPQKKAALIAAVKAARDAQRATPIAISGISGSVTL